MVETDSFRLISSSDTVLLIDWKKTACKDTWCTHLFQRWYRLMPLYRHPAKNSVSKSQIKLRQIKLYLKYFFNCFSFFSCITSDALYFMPGIYIFLQPSKHCFQAPCMDLGMESNFRQLVSITAWFPMLNMLQNTVLVVISYFTLTMF